MAVRLHRAREPLPSLEPHKNAAEAPLAPMPSIGSRPPPTVLTPPKPIELTPGFRIPVKPLVKPLLAGFLLAMLALAAWSLVPERVVVEATPVVTRLDVTATVAGTLEWIAAPGATIEAGAEIARIVPPTSSGDLKRLESALTRAERLLADAKREKARVDDLFRSDRATRGERFAVNGFVRLRQDERDAAKAKLEAARDAAKPVVSSVALVEAARVVESIPARTVVEAGTRIAIVTPPVSRVRFEADVKPGESLETEDGRAVRVVSVEAGVATAEVDGDVTAPLRVRVR